MSEQIRDMLRALGAATAGAGDSYSIRLPLASCFAARGPSGSAALLIPIAGDVDAPGRAFEGVTLDFKSRVRFELPERGWEAAAAVVECVDEELLRTFCVLCSDMAARLARPSGTATTREVIEALWEWENLLRAQARLSDADELGLWGELAFLATLEDIEHGVRAWRGPEGFTVDFFSGGVGVEIKASKARFRHHVSHDQIAAERDFPTYVVSFWLGTDPTSGRTLPEVVEALDGRVTDVTAWERLLLKAGYRRSSANQYTAKYVILDAPACFREGDVPRVRAADPGVRQLRYVVELESDKAMLADEWRKVMSTFVSGR